MTDIGDTNAFALATDPDAILDARRDSFACAVCGSPDPARLYYRSCSDCLRSAIRVRLTPVDTCHWCGRRPTDVNVDFGGRVVGCCDTCWQRAEDEMGRDDA